MADALVGVILAVLFIVAVVGSLLTVLYAGKKIGDVLARRKIEELERRDRRPLHDEPDDRGP